MSIAADIRAIRDRATAELVAAHDYYMDARRAWQFLSDEINAGYAFHATNPVTRCSTLSPARSRPACA